MIPVIQGAAIVVLSVLVCVTYGVLHDQVTARVCLEYFTVGHPPIFTFETSSQTLYGLAWGVIATWWVGVLLGVPLAVASQAGRWPRRDVMSQLRPLLAVAALLAGVSGYAWAAAYEVTLPPRLDELVAREKHAAFIADFFAHNASYAGGFIGGLVLIVRTVLWRRSRFHELSRIDP